ncbi:unnamed protein product [Cylindrotheca closterium]|uniref:signal peptidase I n=1 Tax=Cylindrotheca closterium TaxID=2856 RepID=A0AAD2FVB2_9STRA|nr:unnamed protein product [Cylindrotheca closterium]
MTMTPISFVVFLCFVYFLMPVESFSSSSILHHRSSLSPSFRQHDGRLPLAKTLQDNDDSSSSSTTSFASPMEAVKNSFGFQTKQEEFQKAQADGFGTRARNAAINATVGDILVPLCSNLEQRQKLANQGVYPGVEYEICSLTLLASSDDDMSSSSGDSGDSVGMNGNDDSATATMMTAKSKVVQTLQGLDRGAKQGVIATVKPAYPLRAHLERDDWPVSVALLKDVPLWLAKATYEAGTAVGTLAVSLSGLVMASLVAFWIQLVGVPTPSMLPALQPGTVVLVTRSLPMLGKAFQPKVGDVVFFDAPSELETAISQRMIMPEESSAATASQDDVNDDMANLVPSASSSSNNNKADTSTKGKQLLKRVVAVPNEKVGVRQSSPYVQVSESTYRFDVIGRYARPEIFPADSWNRPLETLGRKEYFVAGDNGYRSVDSRVWGPLQQKYIIGTAQWVVWPLDHFGPIPPGPISEVTKPK